MSQQKVFFLDYDESGSELVSRHAKYTKTHVQHVLSVEELLNELDGASTPPKIILVDHFFENQKNIDKYTKVALEELLTEFGQMRHVLRCALDSKWLQIEPQDIERIQKKLKEKNFDKSTPIAIASRYGRRLLQGKEFGALQRTGIYWCWKHRYTPQSTLELSKSLSDSERNQVEEIKARWHEEIQKKPNPAEKQATEVEKECIGEILDYFEKDIEPLLARDAALREQGYSERTAAAFIILFCMLCTFVLSEYFLSGDHQNLIYRCLLSLAIGVIALLMQSVLITKANWIQRLWDTKIRKRRD